MEEAVLFVWRIVTDCGSGELMESLQTESVSQTESDVRMVRPAGRCLDVLRCKDVLNQCWNCPNGSTRFAVVKVALEYFELFSCLYGLAVFIEQIVSKLCRTFFNDKKV